MSALKALVLSITTFYIYSVDCEMVFCYQCSGIMCEAEPQYLLPCLNELELIIASCYFVAWNTSTLFGIYRGCYEPNDIHLHECNNNRLTNCLVCDGDGCNDWPIFQDVEFSCKKCDFLDCTRDGPIKMNEHPCPRFVTGTVPRCLTIYDLVLQADKFLCANEMSERDFDVCQLDRFETVCRYCETPNCNYENFPLQEYQLICLCSPVVKRYCDKSAYFYKPYIACIAYMENLNLINGTCVPFLKTNEYIDLTRNENAMICNTKECNRPDVGKNKHAHCRTEYSKYEKGFCAASWACCNRLNFITELKEVINWEVCETMTPCWQRNLCKRCCDFFLPEKQSQICHNEEQKLVYNCYQCSTEAECAVISEYSMRKTSQCRMSRSGTCFTHVENGEVHRGCVDLLTHYSFGETCFMGKNVTCIMCHGDYCNSRPLKMFCYHCSFENNRCAYDQELNLVKDCGLVNDINDKIGCMTCVRIDELIYRGCYRSTDPPFPSEYKCNICYGQLCNGKSNHFRECVKCKGDANSDCASDSKWMLNSKVKCPIIYDQPLCYILINANGTVERGCTANVLYKDKLMKYTENDPIKPYFCDRNLCNYFSIDRISRSLILLPRFEWILILLSSTLMSYIL